MKKYILIVTCLVSFSIFASAQAKPDSGMTKEQIAIKKLEDKVKVAETKLEKVNQQIAVQDSIVTACNAGILETNNDIKTTKKEHESFIKQTDNELKALEKRKTKAKEASEKLEIDKEGKEFLNVSNKKNDELEKKLTNLVKKADKLNATLVKANEKLKTLSATQKLAKDALKTAQSNLEVGIKPKK